IPEVDRAVTALSRVIFADVIADPVVREWRGARELEEGDSRTTFIVTVVVLDGAVGASAVKIESSAVGDACAMVVVRFVELDGDGVGVPGPDSEGSAIVGVEAAVVVRLAAFDGAAGYIRENDAVAHVIA